MKADLTRKGFDPLKHFSRVLMQQGRVQLDADWNEQGAILLHLMRRLNADLFGPAAAAGTGFSVTPITTATAPPGDFVIEPGTCYVDGILCELEATPVVILAVKGTTITVAQWTVDSISFEAGQYLRLQDDADTTIAPIELQILKPDYATMTLTMDRDFSGLPLQNATAPRAMRLTTFLTQPDVPVPPQQKGPTPLPSGTYQLYLDVWERLITCIEDDSIREVALNGPDTAARSRVVWQVKALATEQTTCMTPTAIAQQFQPSNRGLLRARTQPSVGSSDPCTISPDSRYRGPENQLYRVEIHTGSGDPSGLPPSFKWSRENGSVVLPIVSLAAGDNSTTAVVASLGRDYRFGLAVGDYVEVQDDWSALTNVPGMLLQVQSIDRTSLSIVMSGTTTGGVGSDPTRHPLLRRWDQKPSDPITGGLTLAPDNAALIAPPGNTGVAWFNLEDGVQITFVTPPVAQYRAGDYWVIPARVATGDVIWPSETVLDAAGNVVTNPVAKGPDGVDHHYAPLAVVTVGGQGVPRRCMPVIRPDVFLLLTQSAADSSGRSTPTPSAAAATNADSENR